jgi:UDP-N-acetylmuramoyl-L-alanyl-D-glutamate--2,6-diaminopimelate ligase
MQLGDFFDDLTLDLASATLEIVAVESDSRACRPGTLFFALSGASTDGRHHVQDAIARGAVAVVSSGPLNVSVPVIVLPEAALRPALAHASAAVTGWPDRDLVLVGITGTNGKTSVATIVAALARELGWSGASVGTLTNARTTPAPPELWRTLESINSSFDPASEKKVVALEVSSHALDQQRVAGVHFAVAAFTNLSHDHLDYHGDMEAYFAAKSILFSPAYASRAVIWIDDPYGARLAQAASLRVTPVSRTDAVDAQLSLTGTTFFWRSRLVLSPLVGEYNVANLLMALTILSDLGADSTDLCQAVSRLRTVPGRFDIVHHQGPTVIVDYAHTPDGLERLLETVRNLSTGRIVTVFGCGGERDRAKRPVMGRIAAAYSDIAVVTSDNPRHEDPSAIIDEIVAGVTVGEVVRIEDRREAIAYALAHAHPSDVVVIAGKGHETTQKIGDEVLAFDDREIARELLR